MSVPTSDQLVAIVETAAEAIANGTALDDQARFQAAGCAVKVAADNNEDDLLNLVILIGAGKYEQAAAALMKLALSESGSQSAPAYDPLAGIVNSGTASVPSAPTATDPTANPAAAPATPAPKRGGRRGQR